MKTTAERVEALRERLFQLHAYEVPEFIVVPVESGSEAYLTWIAKSVTS
jgi:periplasmic divalent cation tolerance protein